MEQAPIWLPELLKKSAAELSIPLQDSSVADFCRFFEELKKWNRAINLTAIQDDREVVVKHFIDSLAGMKVIDIKHESEMLDVGAGAGFPAIPIKLVHPNLSIELLEPSEKKSAFLRFVIGSLNLLKASVVTTKLENYVRRPGVLRRFDYIVVRAFKIDTLGTMIGSLLKDEGKVVLYRTAKIGQNFTLDDLALIQEVEYELPSSYGHRTLSVFSKRMV